jgi:hypothetical protein
MLSKSLLFRFIIAAAVLVIISSCARHPGCTDPNATNYNVNAQVDNGTCLYDVTFYFDQNGPNATVNINNQTGNITANYQSGAPTCSVNATGCANFTLPVGTYGYTASSTLSSWSGTVVVDGSGCQDVVLPQSTGAVVFYTTSNSFGNITVNINSGSGTITSYITSGIPTCGYSGCATFDLAPGVYAYTASSTSGANWNSSVTITADGCQAIQLQ